MSVYERIHLTTNELRFIVAFGGYVAAYKPGETNILLLRLRPHRSWGLKVKVIQPTVAGEA